jgi:formylglycine-generating enzyme required for sulfatase activity
MTEFEYEKACRGTLNAVAYEYPWGTTTMNTSSGGMTNANTVNETMNMIMEGRVHFNWDGGPMRSGFAATSNSNRLQAAATFYGIMEMAGNVVEQCVGGGTGYNYSIFTTANGDGALTARGLANVTGWPKDGGTTSGTILKGGGFYTNGGQNPQMQVSDRQFFGGDNRNANNTRDRNIGGRGVRSY